MSLKIKRVSTIRNSKKSALKVSEQKLEKI